MSLKIFYFHVCLMFRRWGTCNQKNTYTTSSALGRLVVANSLSESITSTLSPTQHRRHTEAAVRSSSVSLSIPEQLRYWEAGWCTKYEADTQKHNPYKVPISPSTKLKNQKETWPFRVGWNVALAKQYTCQNNIAVANVGGTTGSVGIRITAKTPSWRNMNKTKDLLLLVLFWKLSGIRKRNMVLPLPGILPTNHLMVLMKNVQIGIMSKYIHFIFLLMAFLSFAFELGGNGQITWLDSLKQVF